MGLRVLDCGLAGDVDVLDSRRLRSDTIALLIQRDKPSGAFDAAAILFSPDSHSCASDIR